MLKLFSFCVVFLCYGSQFVANGQCNAITNGGYLGQSVSISPFEGPCSIYDDLFVPEKMTLTLQPGAELRFGAGVMLAVNGTLIARGQPDRRIVLTKLNTNASEAPVEVPSDIRLVDEFSVSLGRLQLFYRNKWRGVCANNVNWTQADTDVACRQLGFATGNFSFGTWARNDSSYLLFYSPSCRGNESSVVDCPRSNGIKIGTNICRGQQTVYLRCFGISPSTQISDYWWGLEFYNTTYIPTQVGNVETNDSTSVIQHVDILYAGVTKQLQRVPALRADPTAPSLVNVVIKYSALDGVNFTNLMSPTVVNNVTISHSRGHGMNVESLLGRVNITNSIFTSNQGNGFKVKFLDRRFQIIDRDLTFCSQPNIPNKFPQIITGIPGLGSSCGRRFTSYYGLRLTLNVLEMDIEPAASASVEVFDGYDETSRKIGSYDVVNGSFPMGVTTTLNYMFVKFSWILPPICPSLRFCVKITMIIDTYKDSMPELYMNNTISSNNSQHGLYIENVRNYVMVNSSRIVYNGYGAGVRIFGGAGDVLINSSLIEHNLDSGVNITYDGGWRIFNLTSFSHNLGPGINVTFNRTSVDNFTRYTRIQQTHVSRSTFIGNKGYGIQVGNYCLPGNAVVVNDSYFSLNSLAAVQLFSCFRSVPVTNATNFTIAYNKFDANREHAIKISPLINAFGRISNNTFTNHPKYVLLLDNTEDFLHNQFFLPLSTSYEVWGNSFANNQGHYVANFRLSQGSSTQNMTVMYNVFRDNNLGVAYGNDSSESLNYRYRVSAVVFISSSNVFLVRNHLENPKSPFEVATQLDEMNIILDASKQWWSTTDYRIIINRIFDQYSRFNLARISYHPALDSGWLWTPVLTDRSVPLEVEFLRGNKIGGRLLLDATLKSGQVYQVDRDLSVLLGGRLFIEPGVRLQFSNCLSMSVEGYAKFLGSTEQPIVFEPLPNETTWINSSLIRLVDGDGLYNGRLQVRPSEMAEWGTICREGWSLQDAMLACNQMGLVVDLDGWQFAPLLEVNATITMLPIYRSYVQCNAFDISLMDCIADSEFDHSCDHTQDVYLKCLPPSWGGIRFLSTAVPSVLDTMTISGGGYDDPMARYTVPALQIDYNLHSLNNLIVQDNRGDGILVYHNDVLANSKLANSYVRRNGRNGVSVRSSFFELLNCVVDGNGKAGFDFNPSLTTEEALLLRSGITRTNQIFQFDSNGTINIDREEDVRWILTPRKVFPNNSLLEVEVQVRTFYKVVLDLIDYNPTSSQEEVRVYEGRRVNIRDTTSYWSLINDTIDFPLVSQLNFITIRWFVANTSSGRLTMFVRSRHFDWLWPFPVTAVTNTSFISNGRGITTYQYNQPSNEFYDLFTRHQWTKIYCTGSTFDSNKYEAIYVASVSRYNVLYLPNYRVLEQTTRVAEIEFQIERCTFRRNGLGVVSEHLNVEFSSNVWVWNILDNLFEENLGGGMSLYLPRVNLLDIDLYNHSVNMNATTFRNNSNFEFRLDGFYCNSTISNNIFRDNKCWPGCFSMAGTEKDFEVVDNRFERNAVSRYVIEMNMNSHTPYTQWVDAKVSYNLIQNNFRLDPSKRGIISSPLTYAFGMLGVQNVSINRNLFGWNDLDVEFLAGQTSSSLENYLDVTLNYWGTTDQMKIMQVIFDFDDWNSFSIAEYHPFLISNNFDSFQYVGPKFRSILDLNKPLGGRINENLVLKKRDDPYLVVSDLTVMPGYQLVIEAGVQMLFYPNIGILSLGSLSIIGNKNDRISFGPVPNEVNASLPGQSVILRKKVNHPDIDPTLGYQIRLVDGKLNKNEGFVEIYNNTEKRWSLVCDDGFNERTSEVFCRSMGFEASNSAVFRSPFYDIFVLGYPHMHEQLIEWYWRESFICDGRESGVEECRRRINYALPECMITRRYVFIRCGPRNIPDNIDYWGSIRFNLPTYESGQMTYDFIRMEQVNIFGAGRLHGKRSAAIEGIFRTPETSQVTVQNCLWNAIEYVAAIDRFLIADNVIQNNNGFGIGIESLNGQSTDAVESAFVPLVQNRVPYDAYGFIRMCTVEKLVKVTDRSLLYFKYDFETVDCVKIVRSKQPRKQIGVRFLQVNLFNDTMYENAIELYNSEFIEDSLLIGRISPESSLRDLKRFYVSGALYDTITVRMKASPGYRDYGFVAEVVTIPISGLWRPNIGANQIQQISRNVISKNEAGGFFFHNVGENNMRLSFESNYVTGCGLRLLNITMPGALDIYIQNTKLMTIANNYVDNNAGGVYINTTTRDNQVAIYANITNNIITRNTHAHAFYIEGHRFQGFDVRYNYIAFNDVDYRNIFSAFGVQLNFTYNVVYNNTGQCIMNASVEELVSVTQQYTNNAIYYNWASSFNRSTFFLKSAQFKISNNYLLNPYNIYEIAMFNRTKYMNDEKGLYPSVAATNNWWGRGERAYVAGRIWDRRDDENLIQVDFEPFFMDNSSVLEGKCYPGWKLYGTKCYWYFGGAVPYSVADKMCRENRARIAWARNPTGRETALGEVISQFQFNYNARWQTWVFSEDNFASARCTSLQNYVIEQVDCRSLLPFICEKTPYIIPYMNPVPIILAAVISGCILLLIVAPLSILAIIKSLQRKEEKSERKELLRESFRNSRRSTVATISNDWDGYSHYDKPALTPNQFINISGVTMGDSSTDLNSKVKIPSSSTTSSNFKMAAGPLRLKSSDADSTVVKINGSKNHWKSGVENEISYLSPSRYVTGHDISNQSAGTTNRGFRGDEPRVSIPPPYREDSSSNGVTGMPDLGTSWVTRTAHRSTSSNGIKSPSVRFSPTLKFQASESNSSDEKRGKPPRPPLDVTFI